MMRETEERARTAEKAAASGRGGPRADARKGLVGCPGAAARSYPEGSAGAEES